MDNRQMAKVQAIGRQLYTLTSTMRAAADGFITIMRKQVPYLPVSDQPAALELVAQYEAEVDTQFAATRAKIEALLA
jgi:hypothetical protein